MKLVMKLVCLIIGHNKILEEKHENGYSQFFNVCSQCNKKWFNEQLSEKPIIKKVSSKQKIIKINKDQTLTKKVMYNFYVL